MINLNLLVGSLYAADTTALYISISRPSHILYFLQMDSALFGLMVIFIIITIVQWSSGPRSR